MGNSPIKTEEIKRVNDAYIKCLAICGEMNDNLYVKVYHHKGGLGGTQEFVEKEKIHCKNDCLKGRRLLNREILKKWSFNN